MSRSNVVDAYARWDSISPEESHILSRYIPQGGSVLDLGCGTGRFVEPLRQMGCAYQGVDASSEMLTSARSLHPGVEFTLANIVDFSYEVGDFAAVLLMHNVVDSLYPIERRRSFLESCRDRMGNGVLVLSSHLHGDIAWDYVPEVYHGSEVRNFRASHGWHIAEFEEMGFRVILSVQCERSGKYEWSYFVLRRCDSGAIAT
jgi:SAM-dependent methyltransferase